MLYRSGKGVEKDDSMATEWFRLAAAKGDTVAQHNLGLSYFTGKGNRKDYAESVKWHRKAANKGYPPAEYSMGLRYAKGNGVKQDDAEAASWYLKAAKHGHLSAQNNLGLRYRKGQGVDQDYAEAMKWFREAAERGHSRAQYNLGNMYLKGQGVKPDREAAETWFRKAEDQGHKGGPNRRSRAQETESFGAHHQDVPGEHRKEGRRPPQENGEEVQGDGPENHLVVPDVGEPLPDPLHPGTDVGRRFGGVRDEPEADDGDQIENQGDAVGVGRGPPTHQEPCQGRAADGADLEGQGVPGDGPGQEGLGHQHGRQCHACRRPECPCDPEGKGHGDEDRDGEDPADGSPHQRSCAQRLGGKTDGEDDFSRVPVRHNPGGER